MKLHRPFPHCCYSHLPSPSMVRFSRARHRFSAECSQRGARPLSATCTRIRCEDATTAALRDTCKIGLEDWELAFKKPKRRSHTIVGSPLLRLSIYSMPMRVFGGLWNLSSSWPSPPNQNCGVNTINSSSPRSTTASSRGAWFGGVVGDTLKDAGECGAPMTGIALCLSPGRGTLEVRNIAVKGCGP